MSTCNECDHYRPGGGCDVWIHRKHFEQEANNCPTLTIKGIQQMTDPIVEVFIPNTTKTLSELAASIGQQVEEKNKAYGDWNVPGQILRLLYPNGVPPEQVDDMLTITRILDKLRRIATKKDAFGESPYRDIAGYALLALKKAEQPPTK
jgi:hypothetical protein